MRACNNSECANPYPCPIHDHSGNVRASDQYFVSNPQNRATLSTASAEYIHKHPEATPRLATPVVQPDAQVMERALLRERFADAIYKSWHRAPEDSPMAHLDRYAIVDAILPLVTRECNAARLAFGEQVAKWIIEKSGLKNCHEWPTEAHAVTCKTALAESIRALAAKEQPK